MENLDTILVPIVQDQKDSVEIALSRLEKKYHVHLTGINGPKLNAKENLKEFDTNNAIPLTI